MAVLVVMAVGAAVALAVVKAPKATIISPTGSGHVYVIGSTQPTSFKCEAQGTGTGKALVSCVDSNGVNGPLDGTPQAGQLDTSTLGAGQKYKVTATNGNAAPNDKDTATFTYAVKANTLLSNLTVTFGPSHDATVSALLTRTDNDSPLNGRTVAFSTGSSALCSGVTGAVEDGVASCHVTLTKVTQASLTQSLTATFAAAGNFFGTATTVQGPQGVPK
jgi:hypothetical protein